MRDRLRHAEEHQLDPLPALTIITIQETFLNSGRRGGPDRSTGASFLPANAEAGARHAGLTGYAPLALPGAVSFSSACSGLKNTRSTTTASTVPSGRSTSSSTPSALCSRLTIAKPMFLSSRGE